MGRIDVLISWIIALIIGFWLSMRNENSIEAAALSVEIR